MTTLIVLIAACAALGYVVARPWVVAVAAGAIVVYYVGLDSGWWGNGTGDGWQFVMVVVMAFTASLTGGAAALGRARRG